MAENTLKHCIYWNEPIDLRSGGPRGYLAHLRVGLDASPYYPDVKIWLDRVPARPSPGPVPPLTEENLWRHIEFFENLENFNLSDAEFDRMMRGQTRSVHVHNTPLAYTVRRAMITRGVTDIPLLLTSHCPESNGIEMADQYRAFGMPAPATDRFESAVRFVEELGFRAADCWIFPSLEAMEPYRDTIAEFDNWARGKDIRFVATGAVGPRRTSGASKASFGLEGRKVVSFIGRHNRVKGYDLFREAGLRLLAERSDVSILVAGPQASDALPPVHDRWLELGWYDAPGDVLAASDVFVLPNRRTLFDLVLIEALAMKVPTVASATGGNVSVHDMTAGAIALFDGTPDDLVRKVSCVLDHRRELDEKMADAYERLFTPEKFAARYRQTITEFLADWHIRPS